MTCVDVTRRAEADMVERPSADCYRDAVELWKETGNRHGQAETLVSLGKTLLAMCRQDSARVAGPQALVILELPEAESLRASLHRLDPAAGGQPDGRRPIGSDR
jgi:hypothetical protein